ncbi:uncharacterized protein PGTG_20767 [Puccinia graminis f. sp. tritici CRL 75-36-700-3]|uniref:Uncharacterized protein n=1 Tax=Puccinia graminis f. sp. tritici (strain CRL 75-36-700-3 / race SCCL) TaxID=418459 RepID=H6QP54_PUCGT|nr:uncharacterized protein PGTG_20767 [Puccinia graminis f. sp. tritici CRL 75-36-700-3]EHS63184.1 hypothetical protein PGTG_20767 [Puccinia graminis f. sp. tritici CRL 75-36-700-3]
MLFRKNSNKTTRAPKAAAGNRVARISYFELNKDAKRSKGMSKSASKNSTPTTPPCDVDQAPGSAPPVPERSFVLIAVVGLPPIDLSDWYIVESPAN